VAEYRIPPVGGSYADTVARAQAAAAAMGEMERKQQELAATEERGATIEETSVAVRGDLAGVTERLSQALRANIGSIESETAALLLNVRALEAKAAALERIAAAGGGRGGGGGTPVIAAGGAFEDDSAARQQAVRDAQARNDALVAQRQAAERAAAQQAERLNISAIALQEAVGRGGLSAGAEGYLATGGLTGASALASLERERQLGLTRFPRSPLSIAQFSGAAVQAEPTFVPLTGQRQFATNASGELTAAGRQAQEYERNVESLGGKLRTLSEDQFAANQAYQAAAADYATASTALSRHGALTTEFLGALARGQVTLSEFGSQMTSTIGKFGGWAIAAGLVYGVFDAFKHVTEGATETQGAIQNLGRFIPGLGGPAGGGNAQVPVAEAGLRGLSQQFNLPISDVASAAQVMARTFHNVNDAFQATAGVLALTRLDQVPQAQSEQYLVGIGNALGITRGSGLVNIVNQLNALQAQYGARVVQTLPGLARAAPAALAGGVSQEQLEALVALGVRGGVSGQQVGTALVRSISNFAFRPASQSIFGAYGIQAVPGQAGDLFSQVFRVIDERERAGTLRGQDLRNLSQALGGPLLGGRSILPILTQEAARPGFFEAAVGTAQRPRPYQEDLGAVLGSVKEQFRALGIDLQNFGSALASVGILTPLQAFLTVTNDAAHVLQVLLGPLTTVAGVFGELPGPIKEAVGAFIAFRAGQAFLNTRFGGTATQFIGRLPGFREFGVGNDASIVQGYLGRAQTYVLPEQQRAEEAARVAAFRAQQARVEAQNTLAGLVGQNPEWAGYIREGRAPAEVAGSAAFQSYQETLVNQQALVQQREARAAQLQADAERATRLRASTQADIALAQGQRGTPLAGASYSERAAYLQSIGVVTAEDDNRIAKQVAEERNALARALQDGVEIQTATNRLAAEGLAAARGGGAVGGTGVGVAGASEAAAAASLAPIAAFGARQATEQQVASRAGLAEIAGVAAARETARIQPPSEAPPGVLEQLGLSGVASRVQGVADKASAAIEEAGGIGAAARQVGAAGYDRLLGEGGFLRGGGGLFAGATALSALASALPQGSGIGNALQGGQTALMTALFARWGGAPAALGGLLGIGGQIASGFQTGGVQGGLASTIGTGAGAAIGAILGFGVPGAVIGGGVGGFLGNLAQSIFGGGGPSPQDEQAQSVRTGLDAIRAAQRGFRPVSQSQAGIQADIWSAFAGGGQAGQNAQTRLSTEIPALQAEQYLFGGGSQQGQIASQLLGTLIQSAVENARTNPQAAYQAIQAAEQSREQLTQTNFRYQLATGGPGGAQAAADTATAAYRSQLEPYQSAVTDTVNTQRTAQEALNAALASGNKKRIDAAQVALIDAQNATAGARALLSQASESKAVQIQQAQDQAYQVQTQFSQAQGALAQARAGGSQVGQLRAQLATAQRAQTFAANLAPYDPTAAATDIANAQAQAINIQRQLVEQHLTETKATGAVAEARVFTGDPVAQARQQLVNLTQQYNYMVANRKAFDPSDINNALASVITARQALAQAVSDYNTQMAGIQGQIAEAQDYGNQVAQANDAVRAASAQLGFARTPVQRATAEANLLAARNQGYQAQQATLQSQSQLAQAQASGDPVRQAQIALSYARQMEATAHGIDNIRAAETAAAQAQYQLSQAEAQRISTLGSLQETLDTGDARRQAADALRTAQELLANAQTYDERIAAEQAIAAAEVQRRQGRQQYIAELGQLHEARAGGDAVLQAQVTLRVAREELAAAHGTDQIIQAETQVAQAERQLRQARINRIASLAQVTETRETGDAVAQAQTALAAAQRELRTARGPDQRIAAQQAVASAQAQLHQAQQQRIGALGGYFEALAQGDPLVEAQIAIEVAQAELKNARGVDEQIAAATALANAEYQLHQAQVQRVQSLGALAEAQAQGDPLAQARIAIQTAQQELAMAKTEAETIQAETDLANASYQYHQALQNRITALGALAASETRDPLAQLSAQIAAARQVLANATTDAERIQGQTDLNNLLNQYTAALVSQTEDTINFQLQMRQITAQQAIAQLQGLLKTQNLTLQERQQIEEQIRQLQLGGGTSEFNLAPGNIKLPTIYDIARAVGNLSGSSSPFGTGSVGGTVNATVNSPITVYVADSADVPAVAAAIDSATGSQLAGALRAAGLT
jgi:hypothetical protein